VAADEDQPRKATHAIWSAADGRAGWTENGRLLLLAAQRPAQADGDDDEAAGSLEGQPEMDRER
jgi:hypothetical protein